MKYFVSGNCYVSGNSGYSFWLSDIVEVEKKIETSEELRELDPPRVDFAISQLQSRAPLGRPIPTFRVRPESGKD